MKSQTRHDRAHGVTKRYTFSLATDLPPKKQILTLTENKTQLIKLIVNDLRQNWSRSSENKLMITGLDVNDAPFQIYKNNVSILDDLKNFQEEADVIIIHQLLHAVITFPDAPISVISDDIDVLLLLLHFYKKEGFTNPNYR